jgi:predicted TIM-barrel fold metal-dependent hydrolase
MGEALPFMLDRLDNWLTPKAKNLKRGVAETILDQVYITTAGFFWMAPFMSALLTFGADRILFSVDYPFSKNNEARAFLDNLPIAPADKEKIAHGNADRILKLA